MEEGFQAEAAPALAEGFGDSSRGKVTVACLLGLGPPALLSPLPVEQCV